MRHCADQLMVRMGELREAADALEVLVDDTAWPLPPTRRCCSSVEPRTYGASTVLIATKPAFGPAFSWSLVPAGWMDVSILC